MGIVSLPLSQSNNMKFLLVLAVAAYVKAEADPAFVYSTAGVLPHVYPYAAYPYVHHALPLAAGCTNNDGALVPCAHGLVAPVVAAAPVAAEAEAEVESVAKREAEPVAEATAEADAEADPEADPWLYYSGLGYHHLGYHGYAPFAYSYAPYTYSHAYAHYGLPYAYYGKRSADAEPEADPKADADLYLLYGGYYRPYAYHAGYYPYSYGYPYAYGLWGKK